MHVSTHASMTESTQDDARWRGGHTIPSRSTRNTHTCTHARRAGALFTLVKRTSGSASPRCSAFKSLLGYFSLASTSSDSCSGSSGDRPSGLRASSTVKAPMQPPAIANICKQPERAGPQHAAVGVTTEAGALLWVETRAPCVLGQKWRWCCCNRVGRYDAIENGRSIRVGHTHHRVEAEDQRPATAGEQPRVDRVDDRGPAQDNLRMVATLNGALKGTLRMGNQLTFSVCESRQAWRGDGGRW